MNIDQKQIRKIVEDSFRQEGGRIDNGPGQLIVDRAALAIYEQILSHEWVPSGTPPQEPINDKQKKYGIFRVLIQHSNKTNIQKVVKQRVFNGYSFKNIEEACSFAHGWNVGSGNYDLIGKEITESEETNNEQ